MAFGKKFHFSLPLSYSLYEQQYTTYIALDALQIGLVEARNTFERKEGKVTTGTFQPQPRMILLIDSRIMTSIS